MSKVMHLVQPSSTGKIKFITLLLEGPTLSREWGLMGCKTQTTSNTYDYINKGKTNQLDPEAAAEADFIRLATEKMEEGYREVSSLDKAESVAELDTMNFDNPPKSFAPAKPIKKIEDPAIDKLIGKGNAIPERKENGLRHFIFTGSKGKVTIYTRRMDDHTAKYPHIVEYVKELRIPPCSVLDVELVVDPLGEYANHTAAFNLMQGISKKDTEGGKLKSDLSGCFALQKANRVRGLVFHILFWAKAPIWSKAYEEAYAMITKTFFDVAAGAPLFRPVVLDFKTAEELHRWVMDNKKSYEGVVIWDKKGVAELVFTGKPKRKACYKRKGLLETDCIAIGFEEGTGENQGKIGALILKQIDEKTGKEVDVGKCGAGLSDAQRDPKGWKFPCVIMVEFAERFPTGRMQFPKFAGIHGDKTPAECIMEELE